MGGHATRPMFAIGYAAQAVQPDGMTTLVLENGRVISISASIAATLNQTRQREGQSAIPTVSQSEADKLARRLAAAPPPCGPARRR
jgi:hypothetical protein